MSIFDIALKDIRLLIKDKKAILIVILMPIILMIILSSALSGTFSEPGSFGTINIAIVKEYNKEEEILSFSNSIKDSLLTEVMSKAELEEIIDNTDKYDFEQIFFEEFLGSKEIENIINYEIISRDSAMTKLENGEISAIVILPKGLLYDINMRNSMMFSNKAKIQIIKDTKNIYKPMIVENIIGGFCDKMSTVSSLNNLLVKDLINNDIDFNQIGALIEEINSQMSNSTTSQAKIIYQKSGGKKSINSFSYYAAAMSAMFILFMGGHVSEWLKRENDEKTLLRLKAANVKKSQILFGKFFASFVLSMFQFITLYIFSSIILKVDWGSVQGTIFNILVSAFAVSSLGILLSVIVYVTNKDLLAGLFNGVIIQIMSFLGGSYIPTDTMPKIVKFLGNLTINGNMLNVSLNNMQGLPLSDVFDRLLTNFVIGVVLFIIAVFIYFKEDRYGRNTNVKV